MNSPPLLLLVSQNPVYATPEQQGDSSSENNDSSPDANEGSETTQENADSEQSEGSNSDENKSDNGSDSTSSDQKNTCRDTNDFADVPTFIGQDGCVYPCPSSDDQSNIHQGCPSESQAQATTGFSINKERPIQSQQPLQTTTNEPQQNTQTSPNQNAVVNPRIDSDRTTRSNIPTTETTPITTTTTTQKSYSPAGQYKPGTGQIELTIPGKSDSVARPLTPGGGNAELEGVKEDNITKRYDPTTPYSPGAGNTEMKGSSLIPNSQSELSIPGQTNGPTGKYNPGTGQTELSIPESSYNPAVPYTPDAGNSPVKGIPSQPNTNPQTPIEPGKITTTIPDKAYLTVITKMMNFYTGFLKVSDFEICVKTTIQTEGKFRDVDAIPRCANGSTSGFQYTVQAPGSITIWVNNLDELGVKSVIVETPNLSNHIDAFETKSSTIYISPYSS